MTAINDEFVERYQKLWDEDQTSRVFAPLAEAYRRTGNLQRALQTCRQGLNLHPNFAGGWYQLAKVYFDRKELEKALEALRKTTSLAPENFQAHNLMADILLQLRRPKEALKAFKMILLVNPHDVRAKKAIEKLESLTADEYSEETFQVAEADDFTPLQTKEDSITDLEEEQENPEAYMSKLKLAENKALEQTITMIDALLVRNEFTKAKSILLKATKKFGLLSDLQARINVIERQREKSLENESPEIIQPVPPRPERIRLLKIKKLRTLLLKLTANKELPL